MRNLLRLLFVVIVDMLFNRVALGQHVKDLALIDPLFDLICVALPLDIHNLLTFDVKHMLASFQSSLKLSLLLFTLA